MDENLHNIEDLFFSELNDNEEAPSEKVWEKIDKRLDKENEISIKKKYTSLKRIAITLLFLLSGFIIYLITAKENNNNRLKEKISEVDKSKKSANVFKLKEKALPGPLKNININNLAKSNAQKKSIDVNIKSGEEKAVQSVVKSSDNSKTKNKYSFGNAGSSKIILKNKSLSNISKKARLTSKPFYKEKIKNAQSANGEQTLIPNNDEPVNHKTSSLRNLKNLSTENEQLHSKDLVDTKKLSHPIVSSATIVLDTTHKAVAKNIPKKKEKISRFSLTPFFSPDIAWYHLSNDNTNNQSNATELENEEKHEFSSTYGALADYTINKYWGLQSGLALSNTNIIVQPETIYAQKDNTGNIKYRINTSSGYGYILPSFSANPAVGDSLYAFSSSHSLQYINIPLALTYNVTKGKFKFNVLAGISSNFLLKAMLKTSVEKGFDNSIETVDNLLGPKKVYFSGLAGAGVDYKLMRNTSITFAPVMRFALNPINKDAAVKSYPTSFGFAAGLKIGL